MAVDHLAVPGYLKSWTNTQGLVHFQSLGQKIVKPARNQEATTAKECRKPSTDLDRLLIEMGIDCL